MSEDAVGGEVFLIWEILSDSEQKKFCMKNDWNGKRCFFYDCFDFSSNGAWSIVAMHGLDCWKEEWK